MHPSSKGVVALLVALHAASAGGFLFASTVTAQQNNPAPVSPQTAQAQPDTARQDTDKPNRAQSGPSQPNRDQPSIVQPGAPGQATKTLPASTRPSLPPLSSADVEFMQGMIMHHSQAVEMTALIASHTENKSVRTLGAKISSSQSDEIRFMQRWLAARGEPTSMAMPAMPGKDMPGMDMSDHAMAPMPGMLTPVQMDALRKAKDARFDELFLIGMIQHHNGALIMVKDLFDTAGAGQDADIFNFATDADNTQRAEIKIMQNMLEEKH